MTNKSYLQAYEDLAVATPNEVIQSARVVIFTSGLADIRIIVNHLLHYCVPFRLIEMAMQNAHNRKAYRELSDITGWKLMPQIFIDGEFIGGIDELFRHSVIISYKQMKNRDKNTILQ